MKQMSACGKLMTRIDLVSGANRPISHTTPSPLVMLALAWAALPDLPTYRTGVIMVGLARCIAMVMVWNELARGDAQSCAVLVVLNSVLQIALYSPYAVWFVNVMGGAGADIRVAYGDVAISVLIVSVASGIAPGRVADPRVAAA